MQRRHALPASSDTVASVAPERAPLMAARLGVEEGKSWRELRAFVRGVEEEIAGRGAVKLLAEAGKAGDNDGGTADEGRHTLGRAGSGQRAPGRDPQPGDESGRPRRGYPVQGRDPRS